MTSKTFRFTDEDIDLLGELTLEAGGNSTQTIRRGLIALRRMLDDGYSFRLSQTGRGENHDTILRSEEGGQAVIFYEADEHGRLTPAGESRWVDGR